MKKIILYSTNIDGIFNILSNASKIHLSNKLKKKVILKKIKKRLPSVKFCLFFLSLFFSGKIFDSRNFVYLKFEKYSVGKHVLSETRRFYISYNNSFIFFIVRCKILFSAGRIINTANKIKNISDAIFIDHLVYLNGLYFEIFYRHKKIIYSNGFPKGFFVIDATKNKNSYIKTTSNIFKVTVPIKIKNYQKNLSLKMINKNFIDPRNITYMKKVSFNSIDKKIDFSQVSHVVYAHSFTDAQLPYGIDGFSDTFDWLNFTIDNLSKLKTKIIIKGHPNFYNKNPNELSRVDNKIFQKVVKLFSNKKNLIFLNSSIKNRDLLRKLKKDTILVTHHGTLIFDASIFKNKVITSSQTFYDKKFKITNTWDDLAQYQKLLNKNYNQLKHDYRKLLNVSYGLYFNKYNAYGKYFYIKIIKKYIKLKNNNIDNTKITELLKKLKTKKSHELFSELANKIEEFKI